MFFASSLNSYARKDVNLPKVNYKFEKRKRELDKKRKKEQKEKLKQLKKEIQSQENQETQEPQDTQVTSSGELSEE